MSGQQFLWGDQPPGLLNVKSQLVIADAVEFDANPAANANVGRSVEFPRVPFDQYRLHSGRSRQAHGDVPIVVMIIGKHHEHLLRDEERWLAVG